jgi:CHAD domain-containing protein
LAATLPAPRTQVPSPPEPRGPLSARQALQQIARACVQQIQENEPKLRRSRSPEALHQIRVALRRWRTALSIFGPASGPGQGRTKSTLKWLASELNEARDLDVFAAAFEPRRHEDGGAEALWTALEAARARAYDQADDALQSDRLRRLLWRTAQTARPAANDDEGPEARKLAAAALERRWRKLKKRGRNIPRLDPLARHGLRIQAKKVRYGAELCGQMFDHPRRQRKIARALKALQDSLGVLNDLAVGEKVALRLAREAGTPEAAFAAGRLTESRARREAASVLKQARGAYEDLREAGRFWAGALDA